MTKFNRPWVTFWGVFRQTHWQLDINQHNITWFTDQYPEMTNGYYITFQIGLKNTEFR